MDDADIGGEDACLVNQISDAFGEIARGDVTAVDLDASTFSGSGVAWSLPHGGDLDVNVVHLDANGTIERHVNDAVDVLVVVWSGGGRLDAGEIAVALHAGVLAHVRRGVARSVSAGPNGLTYLSVHRRREGLTIGRR